MRVTVAICTWNRADLLRQTLEGLSRIVVPGGVDWELIVVMNNCTDHTEEVVRSFSNRLPLRPLAELTPGLSMARNAAVAASSGDYIIWTDDDVLVDKDWLSQYVEAFAQWPGAAVFGGPILPWFPSEPPAWLQRAWSHVGYAFAMRDLGGEPVALDHKTLPFGANFAVRRLELQRHRFDPSLGYKGGIKIAGEETALTGAILAEGGEGRWVPEARVQHYIPPERLTKGYLHTYFFGRGQQMALQSPSFHYYILGRPAWLWVDWLRSELRFRVRRMLCPPEIWVRDLCDVSFKRGWWSAARRSPGLKVAPGSRVQGAANDPTRVQPGRMPQQS